MWDVCWISIFTHYKLIVNLKWLTGIWTVDEFKGRKSRAIVWNLAVYKKYCWKEGVSCVWIVCCDLSQYLYSMPLKFNLLLFHSTIILRVVKFINKLEKLWLMPKKLTTALVKDEVNWVPLSERIALGKSILLNINRNISSKT